jgi:predicted transcriptional regulator YdeE
MVTYEDDMRKICKEYYVLYDKRINEFEKVIIPASKWLKFRINSQNAKDIQEMSQKFYMEFLPSCKYNLKELPELEYYHDNITDFLVPIC